MITVSIDPNVQLGPLTLTWHGIAIAVGLGVGGVVAARWARQQGLEGDWLTNLGLLVAAGGIVGGKIFYALEHGGSLLSTRGFTFDGGVILAALLLAAYVRRTNLSGRYLDAVAVGLPVGVAVGRIGDVINGEHYGPRSDFFLAVRNANPDALTPNRMLAYQNGGLYEVLLGALVFVVMWALRNRLTRTGDLAWLVLVLFAAGRFFEFFVRSDSPSLALGLDNAQWTSLVLLALSLVGWVFTARRDGGSSSVRRSGPPFPR